ncbi:hypothetical protein C9374_005367 [Naegleria lovaniensis]|uniref:Uncharacterized protein n=1 Tax=Naegleria lovaniensis TaxID=51637 RepID=A0AA88GL10_NAELO|nr:uncharacterized protein C9374_005367 [Naegleria lovaniensis]KAG2382165.1 hypothetical protein C9374_005367 [Naegleria lovaniensis]
MIPQQRPHNNNDQWGLLSNISLTTTPMASTGGYLGSSTTDSVQHHMIMNTHVNTHEHPMQQPVENNADDSVLQFMLQWLSHNLDQLPIETAISIVTKISQLMNTASGEDRSYTGCNDPLTNFHNHPQVQNSRFIENLAPVPFWSTTSSPTCQHLNSVHELPRTSDRAFPQAPQQDVSNQPHVVHVMTQDGTFTTSQPCPYYFQPLASEFCSSSALSSPSVNTSVPTSSQDCDRLHGLYGNVAEQQESSCDANNHQVTPRLTSMANHGISKPQKSKRKKRTTISTQDLLLNPFCNLSVESFKKHSSGERKKRGRPKRSELNELDAPEMNHSNPSFSHHSTSNFTSVFYTKGSFHNINF